MPGSCSWKYLDNSYQTDVSSGPRYARFTQPPMRFDTATDSFTNPAGFPCPQSLAFTFGQNAVDKWVKDQQDNAWTSSLKTTRDDAFKVALENGKIRLIDPRTGYALGPEVTNQMCNNAPPEIASYGSYGLKPDLNRKDPYQFFTINSSAYRTGPNPAVLPQYF